VNLGEMPAIAVRPEGHRFVWLMLLIATIVGVCLRFDDIALRDFWLDESCTFYYVHNLSDWPADGPDPWLELTTIPYLVALDAWTWFTGETILGFRSFSAVAGCATTLALGLIGWRMGGGGVALIVAVLTAVHPLHIHYSQEARVYALWVFVITLMIFALHVASRTGLWRWWFAYSLLALLSAATHYYALFLLPASFAGIALAQNRRRFVKQWATTGLVLGVVMAPWLIGVVFRLTERGSQGWLLETWEACPPLLAIPKSLWVMLPSGGYPDYIGVLAHVHAATVDRLGAAIGSIVLWTPAVLIAGAFALWLVRGRVAPNDSTADRMTMRDQSERDRTIRFLLGFVLCGLAVPFLYSLLVRPAYVVGRYDTMVIPAMMLVIAMLLDGAGRRLFQRYISGRLAIAGATIVLVLCSMVVMAAVRSTPPNREPSERARRIAELVDANDLIISFNMYRWFVAFELHRQGFKAEMISYPPIHDKQVGWQNPQAELSDPAQVETGVREVLSRVSDATEKGRRVFLLFTGEPTPARKTIDGRFLRALRESGYDIQPVDEWLGLAAVLPEGERTGKPTVSSAPPKAPKKPAKLAAQERAVEREHMVKTQIEARGITDRGVLEAMRNVPRHWFVPKYVAPYVYEDGARMIGYDQTISQPYIVAFMTEALKLTPESKVLEIGTGSGYQAAVLSEITPHVYTIEIVEPLARRAMKTFERRGYDTIKTKIGDGYAGWPAHAPFDAIIVTCAPGHIPHKLFEQLEVGGRMCIPVGEQHVVQKLLLITKRPDGTMDTEDLMPVRFVPMTGEAREQPQ